MNLLTSFISSFFHELYHTFSLSLQVDARLQAGQERLASQRFVDPLPHRLLHATSCLLLHELRLQLQPSPGVVSRVRRRWRSVTARRALAAAAGQGSTALHVCSAGLRPAAVTSAIKPTPLNLWIAQDIDLISWNVKFSKTVLLFQLRIWTVPYPNVRSLNLMASSQPSVQRAKIPPSK